ncbi:conserved hypothetical protein [Perkinsus marinus ATCC 50983]|uniref:Thiol-disulfide oxidoreductase DCC n=1 Tax=Perkinsus marinus (strain ATCC 50983 / TXsc) TaxID=423536 RepID=C5LXL0_PERM5|nr:conserved hypothetical protein [Perkinsus marinus ATCC 50983]EEQ98532.1 conserved hypothetical protein [Perkinsus marinus ATCC 50983]|eukprot:XP_002765815.1 conserved hypothetical protein [Perkinsus marinus ATCC 50983]
MASEDLRTLPEAERSALAVKGPTFIFDGVCNLCNTALRFVNDHVRPDADVKYMWTNHPDTLKVLEKYDVNEEDINKSWGYLKDGQLYRGSTAWLMGLRELTAPWCWAYYLIHVPEVIREFVYNLVAANRYRWFGRSDQCHVVEKSMLHRFLHTTSMPSKTTKAE